MTTLQTLIEQWRELARGRKAEFDALRGRQMSGEKLKPVEIRRAAMLMKDADRAEACANELEDVLQSSPLDRPSSLLGGGHGQIRVGSQLPKDEARVEQLEAAIRWALGEEGEFGKEPEPLAGKYRRRFWWRSELRRRAGMEDACPSAAAVPPQEQP